jgi:hypothetical protein
VGRRPATTIAPVVSFKSQVTLAIQLIILKKTVMRLLAIVKMLLVKILAKEKPFPVMITARTRMWRSKVILAKQSTTSMNLAIPLKVPALYRKVAGRVLAGLARHRLF